jgi:hypothetical protein
VANRIPSPRVPLIDANGLMSPAWYRYFAGSGRELQSGEVEAGAGLDGGGLIQNGVSLSIDTNGVTDEMIRQGHATSVIGRYQGSTGNVADIAATDDDRVLQRISGQLVFAPVKAKEYAVADAPDAADYAVGTIIYVPDEAGGATLAVSDGTDWLRVADGAVIS